MNYCSPAILRRSQEDSPEPNFLFLLGNRNGWRALPEEISLAEFDKLLAAAKSRGAKQQPLRATHGKTAVKILRAWYRCDENVLVPILPETAPDRTPLNYILRRRVSFGCARSAICQFTSAPPCEPYSAMRTA